MARILTTSEIVFELLQGRMVVAPLLDVGQVGATLDLRLGTEFVVKKMDRLTHLDPVELRREQDLNPEAVATYYDTIKKVDATSAFVLHPGQFALGSTLEYVRLPPDIGGMLEGRSGWAREGLNVHSTAGLIHPGHRGIIVFELQNAGTLPLPLYPGIRVAQLLLYRLESPTERSYDVVKDSKYVNHVATSYGRPWEDWEFRRLAEVRG